MMEGSDEPTTGGRVSKLSTKHRVSDEQLLDFVFEEFSRQSGEYDGGSTRANSRMSFSETGDPDGCLRRQLSGCGGGGGGLTGASWPMLFSEDSSVLPAEASVEMPGKKSMVAAPGGGGGGSSSLRSWSAAAPIQLPDPRRPSTVSSGSMLDPGGGLRSSWVGGGTNIAAPRPGTAPDGASRKRNNSVPIRVASLARHESIPCPQTGRRCTGAQDDQIRVYVCIPVSGDRMAFWVDPELPLGPEAPAAEEKNAMTELWGADYEANGPWMGRLSHSQTTTPAAEKGRLSLGGGSTNHSTSAYGYPTPDRGPLGELLGLPSPPGSPPGSKQQSSTTSEPFSPEQLSTDDGGGLRDSPEPDSLPRPGDAAVPPARMKEVVGKARKLKAQADLKDAAEFAKTPLERFRLAAKVVQAEVREKVTEAEDPTTLKGLIHKTFGVPVERQILFRDKMRMDMNQSTLRQYGIGHGATVNLVVKKRKPMGKEEINTGRTRFLASTALKNQKLQNSSFIGGRIERMSASGTVTMSKKHDPNSWVMPKWQHDELPGMIDRDHTNKGENCRFAERPPYYKEYGCLREIGIQGRGAVDRIRQRFGHGAWAPHPRRRGLR